MKSVISVDETIDLLNEILNVDPEALNELITGRVSCNVGLADHPTVQVGLTGDGFEVGMLGFLNGLFGVNNKGYGAIVMITVNDRVVEFKKTEGWGD